MRWELAAKTETDTEEREPRERERGVERAEIKALQGFAWNFIYHSFGTLLANFVRLFKIVSLLKFTFFVNRFMNVYVNCPFSYRILFLKMNLLLKKSSIIDPGHFLKVCKEF